jgi:glucan biosynthesis protein C
VFVLFNQAWFMGALFFLAGFFTPRSYDRKGAGAFLRDRLVRLGIPLVVYAYVLNPIAGLGVFLMPSDLTGITFGPTWSTYPELVGMGPLWFVAMLLIFSVGYALWASLRGPSGTAIRAPGIGVVGGFVLVLAATSYLVRMVVPLGESVLQFPTLAYLPQYLSFFVLGAVAHRNGWMASLTRRVGWAGAAVAAAASVLLFPLAFSGHMFSLEITDAFQDALGDGRWQSAVYALWDSAFAVGLLLASMVVFRAFVDGRSRLGSFLSQQGYAVYVVHTPIVVIGAYVLRGLEMTAVAKAAVVALILVPVCVGIAFLVRSVPGMKRVL